MTIAITRPTCLIRAGINREFFAVRHSRQSRRHPLRWALDAAEEVNVEDHLRLGGIINTPTEQLLTDINEPDMDAANTELDDDDDDVPLSMLYQQLHM